MRSKSKGKQGKAGGKKAARAEAARTGSWRTPGSAETGALGSETAGPSEYAQRKDAPHGKSKK